MDTTATVVVFAKRPVLGGVKSRLAADIGAQAALTFYETELAALMDRLEGRSGWNLTAAVTPDDAVSDACFTRPGWRSAPQGPGDLGERMARILREATQRPVIIVGSDVPEVSASHIQQAIDTLASHDLVVGPSPDGGYWLIGASRPTLPGLFDSVRWSSAHALEDTLANATGLTLARLGSLEDVDDGPSYARYLARQS